MKEIYVNFFKNIDDNYDIIDIGAGSGFSHKLINNIGYQFNNYYFIEPSINMSSRFENSHSNNTLIINDYIENLWAEIKRNKNKKVFIMNAALHHIIDLEMFSQNLGDAMGQDDFFFIPHEPNNQFHGSFYCSLLKISDPQLIVKAFIKKIAKVILSEYQVKLLKSFFKKPNQGVDQNIDLGTLDLAHQDLFLKGIINSGFKKDMIYAITDYGVYNNWRDIDIPCDWNEGFYSLASLPKILKLKVVYQKTYSYEYNGDFPLFKKQQKFDALFRRFFPRSGAILCLALKKY